MTDNELIAEFMGSMAYEDARYGVMWPDPTNDNKVGFGLKYDKSWDWLMPVVEKIANLYAESNHDRYWSKAVNDLRMPILSTSKDYVYKSVVEFIKWYNSQK